MSIFWEWERERNIRCVSNKIIKRSISDRRDIYDEEFLENFPFEEDNFSLSISSLSIA